jgi:Nucleotidyl transferase AbiEii toxin, Type IV TA system
VRPVVLLEFGARSTGEPFERRAVSCDAASHLPEVRFPEAVPAVMRPELTFWEKATAMHVFCRGGRFRGSERFSRHWYDIASLDRTEFVASAISDRDLAQRVARHKSIFFREKDGEDRIIDYEDAVRGGLQLVPAGEAEDLLAEDYAGMVSDGLLFEDAPDFTTLVAQCREVQNRANQVRS